MYVFSSHNIKALSLPLTTTPWLATIKVMMMMIIYINDNNQQQQQPRHIYDIESLHFSG